MEHEAYRCPHCGTFPDDYLDEEGKQKDIPPNIPYSIRCYGCVVLESENELARKNDTKGGLHIRLVPNVGRNSRQGEELGVEGE